MRFQPSLSGTLSLARTNAFFLGGGKSLVNAYYRTAMGLGVEVIYEAPVTHLEFEDNRVARIDSRTLQVEVVDSGHGPTYLAALPAGAGPVGALVLNVLGGDASIFTDDAGASADSIRVQTVDVESMSNWLMREQWVEFVPQVTTVRRRHPEEC